MKTKEQVKQTSDALEELLRCRAEECGCVTFTGKKCDLCEASFAAMNRYRNSHNMEHIYRPNGEGDHWVLPKWEDKVSSRRGFRSIELSDDGWRRLMDLIESKINTRFEHRVACSDLVRELYEILLVIRKALIGKS